jgi:hypothetical protein
LAIIIILFLITIIYTYKVISNNGLSIKKFDEGDYSKIFSSVKIQDKNELMKILRLEKSQELKTSFYVLMGEVINNKGNHHDLLIKIDEFNKKFIKNFDFKFNSILHKLTLLLLVQLQKELK